MEEAFGQGREKRKETLSWNSVFYFLNGRHWILKKKSEYSFDVRTQKLSAEI